MPYLDEDKNEIGSLGDTRGWIEATGYTGHLFHATPGFPPLKCSWQFARQWWAALLDGERPNANALAFIQKYDGDKE